MIYIYLAFIIHYVINFSKSKLTLKSGLFLFFLILFITNALNGQQVKPDSLLVKNSIIDSSQIFVNNIDDFNISSNYRLIDTSLYGFHQYDPLNSDDILFANTGNIGMPARPIQFINSRNSLFSVGENRMLPYMFNILNTNYFKSYSPYSEVTYVNGSKEENFLKFTLGNQLSKGLYFGTDLGYESSKGIFYNQTVKNNHFRTIILTDSRSKKYHLQFNYLRNKFSFGENGGLVNDFYYEDTTRLDRRLLEVNLYTALNQILTNEFVFNQLFNFGDTLQRLGSIFWEMNYSKKSRIYMDDGDVTNYYSNIYIDSLKSFDSTSIKNFNSYFGWQSINDSLGFSYKIGAQLEFYEYYTGDSIFFYHFLNPRLYLKYKSHNFEFVIKGKYQFALSDQLLAIGNNNYAFDGLIQYKLNDNLFFNFEGLACKFSPEFSNYKTFSNHFQWYNHFEDIRNLSLIGKINFNGYMLGLTLAQLSNFVYFTDSLVPQQNQENIKILKINFNKNFRFRRFGSDMRFTYQQLNDEKFYRLPPFIARANVFFSFRLFNGVLQVFPGVEASFVSSYFADGYNPSNMIFYVQNTKKIEDQIYIDIFANFKIKRARVFIKYSNINMLFGNYNYFLTTHYPLQDPAFKFGVSWRFYD